MLKAINQAKVDANRGEKMELLKKENAWVWVLLFFLTGGTSVLMLGALLGILKKGAWYSKWYYWVLGIITVLPGLIMLAVLYIYVLAQVCKKLKVGGSEIYAFPYTWILCLIVPIIGWILFFVMFAYSGASINAGVLVKFGALSSMLVQNGQFWRLITTGFVHSGFLHLLFNMYSLYLIGTQLENFVGKGKFLAIYFFSMISASLMSCVMHPYAISVGASGALFGLLGALVYFGWHYRLYLGSILRNQIIPIIVLNLFLGFVVSGIDNAAHIGGLIGGFLIAMALGVQKTEDKQARINGIVASVLYIAFLVYVVFFR